MKAKIFLSLLVTTLLIGCQKGEKNSQLEAMRKAISEMKSTQVELKKQVSDLTELVKEATDASLKATDTLADLKESIEATKAAAIDREKRRELQEVLNRKLRLAENFGERGQYTDAYKVLKDLVKEYPNEPQGLQARSRLLEWGVTDEDMKKSDEEVVKLLKNNVQRRRSAQKLNVKALGLEQSGDFIGAIKLYQKIAKEYSDVDEVRWVSDMLNRCNLADMDVESLPPAKKGEVVRRFKIRREIDMAHSGGEQPNLETASQLLEIIRKEPNAPETEEVRRYFYNYGVTKEELATLTPEKLKGAFGERIKKIAAAQRRMEYANSLINQKRFADAVIEFQKIVHDCPDVPRFNEVRQRLREWGLQDVEITDDNRDEINARIAETFQRQREIERAEGLIRGKRYFEAAKILQRFLTKFPDAPESQEVQEMLGRWNIWDAELKEDDREEVNKVAAQAEAARRAMERTEMLEGTGQIKKALYAYQEIARKYPETQAGIEAERRLLGYGIAVDEGEITDADIAKAKKRRAVREEFGRAELLLRNERYLEAIKKFQEIVKSHPGIPEAREAENILRGCGAWGVEVNEQNKDEIIAILKEMVNR